MNIIIPLGGKGKRFSEFGYTQPKPLIKVLGKEILFWVIDCLKLSENDKIYIPYNEELDYYNFENYIRAKYSNIEIKAIKDTRGAAETIYEAIKQFNIKGETAIIDGDTWYEDDIIEKLKLIDSNAVLYFISEETNPIYSYILTDNTRIIDIKEKQKISNKANTGCYFFKSTEKLLEYLQKIDFEKSTHELYISHVIKNMLDSNESFVAIPINKFHILGTPKQIIHFSETFKISPKRFCFDLDNTIVTYPKIAGDYTSVEPIWSVINVMRKLKNKGHTIIIYTSRRMKTHNGNVGAVIKDIGKITIDTLNKYNIPYDELVFGKPYADFYIDDLMINPKLDLNKELGFYLDNVKPRHFNKTFSEGTFFIKESNSNEYSNKINAEKYYYEWVNSFSPENIRKYFPKIYPSKENSIKIDLIDGLTFSSLYVNGILTTHHLQLLIDALKQIHQVKENDTIYYDYYHYNEKLFERWNSFDYVNYGLNWNLFNELINKLKDVCKKGIKRTMIHGDPVFSNVLLDKNDNIKFVDVRGIEGNTFTIYGHNLYDYAKIYQSLTGYDEILLDKRIKRSYKENLLSYYENLFSKEELEHIKLITASLYFSLIPLHNEKEKYIKYVKLFKELL